MAHVDQSSPTYMQHRAQTFSRLPRCERQRHMRKHRWIAWRDGAILREVLIALNGRKCAACGRCWGLTIDHILPISRGGRTVFENLQLLCSRCNHRKSNLIMDFREAV